jgi:peptidoglycan hydrolase-like protein with peptidoglycan-binding domain
MGGSQPAAPERIAPEPAKVERAPQSGLSPEAAAHGAAWGRRAGIGAAANPGGSSGNAGEPALDPLARSERHLSEADPWSQYRALGSVQRLAGNRSAAKFISRLVDPRAAPRHWFVQREGSPAASSGVGTATGAANAPAGVGTSAAPVGVGTAAAPPKLANRRFAGLPRLQAIAAGGPALNRKDPRPVVKAVQQALLDIGYSLLKYQTDGGFGSETEQAIQQFRADRGLPAGAGLDQAAMLALDGAAPAKGEAQEHYVDYDRLFADGKLDITLALGYDEKGLQHFNIEDAHAWLTDRGFKAADSSPRDPNAISETWTLVRKINFPTRAGSREERDITINFQLLTPGAGASKAYGKALSDSELTIYAGHARKGVGPDFDDKHTPVENFVIGVNSALKAAGRTKAADAVRKNEYTVGKLNDLEEMGKSGTFDKDKYRVWFFNGCGTIAYMDELRGGGLPPEVDRRNLDLFGTTSPPATFQVLSQTSLTLVDGILAGETMEGMLRSMDKVGLEAMLKFQNGRYSLKEIRGQFKKAPYFREGAGDNPVAPATPKAGP